MHASPLCPLYCSLILINEQIYGQLRQQIVASQMPDRQQHLAACLEKLMLVRLAGCLQAGRQLGWMCHGMDVTSGCGSGTWRRA